MLLQCLEVFEILLWYLLMSALGDTAIVCMWVFLSVTKKARGLASIGLV